MSWTEFITEDVNNSISYKKDHYTSESIVEIFKKDIKELNSNDEYALKIVFTESFLQAVYNFLKESKIDFDTVKEKYEYMKDKGIINEKFEWFFRV